MKINDVKAFPGLFEKEAFGLKFLQKHSSFTVPEVIDFGVSQNHQYLALEWKSSTSGLSEHEYEIAGRQLAEFHKDYGERFGLEHDNILATLGQDNMFSDSWPQFYMHQRLLPMLKLAHHKGRLTEIKESDLLRMAEVFPLEKPSPLHGDLWSGNTMAMVGGEMALVDPAVYFGHRYMDVAMTQLFGGFSDAFYYGYETVYPFETGAKDGLLMAQLYPILVHVLLFGSGYTSRARKIINHFS